MAPKNEVVTEERRRLPQKKWPLLVRSLSDSAKYLNRNAARAAYSANSANSSSEPRSVLETKALTLSLSDSRLFSGGSAVTSTRGNHNGGSNPKKHHSSLLDIWSDKDPELCSCGCDQDLAEEDDEEEDYSDEDEGCFVITSVPQSNEPEEVTNKVTWQ